MLTRVSGKKILDLLYKNSGMTWLELCGHFGARNSNYMPLYFCMQSIAEFGLLVSVDGLDTAALPSYFHQRLSDFGDKKWRTIRVSDAWRKLEYTLHHQFDYSDQYSETSKRVSGKSVRRLRSGRSARASMPALRSKREAG